MAKYLVEFTAWMEVSAKADDEEHARDKAMEKLEKLYPNGEISLGDVEEN